MDLMLTVGIQHDGTLRMPLLDRVPAAGLSISELIQVLESRYDAYFILPPAAHADPPPHITVQFIGHSGGTALDKMIERIGKLPTTR